LSPAETSLVTRETAGRPRISLVVAAADNGVIGRDGGMPWHLPADLAHFKKVTMGKPVVMGRRTHESIGRPLPGRLNLVLSRDPGYQPAGCRRVGSLDEAVSIAADTGANEVMVIGGGGVYRDALPVADRIILTRVHAEPEGDTWFPDPEPGDWREASRSERAPDDRNPHALSFIELRRRR
jgi:dihydrofolate reductase